MGLTGEDVRTVIAVLSLLLSTSAFIISYRNTARSQITSKRPVLVFAYDGSTGWQVLNVGNGPALNVVVAQKYVGGGWFNPVRIPPVAKDGRFALEWLGHANDTGLGAEYTDVDGHAYSTTCGNDLSQVVSGRTLPVWSEAEIGRHWGLPPYQGHPPSLA